MPQTPLNTTPLFRTSLRSWQANYKANRAQAEGASDLAAQPTATAGARPNRFGRRKRRAK
jgi:hypothetical protein